MGFSLIKALGLITGLLWKKIILIDKIIPRVIMNMQFIFNKNINKSVMIKDGRRVMRMFLNLFSHLIQTLTQIVQNIQMVVSFKVEQKLEMVLKGHKIFTFAS